MADILAQIQKNQQGQSRDRASETRIKEALMSPLGLSQRFFSFIKI